MATWQDSTTVQKAKPVRIQDVAVDAVARMSSGDVELDRVLGGGIVPGSVVLVGGEPGIGKSTLLLQVALAVTGKVVYVSGEESEQQIKLRSARVTEESSECFLLTETNTQSLLHHLGALKPALVIIDSIQTLHSDLLDSTAGSVSQIRACTAELDPICQKHPNTCFFGWSYYQRRCYCRTQSFGAYGGYRTPF